MLSLRQTCMYFHVNAPPSPDAENRELNCRCARLNWGPWPICPPSNSWSSDALYNLDWRSWALCWGYWIHKTQGPTLHCQSNSDIKSDLPRTMRLIIALALLCGFLQQIEAASSNDDISDDEGKETQTILPRLKYSYKCRSLKKISESNKYSR